MSQSGAWWRVLVISTIVLAIVIAMGASGQDKKSAGVYAIVDLQKVFQNYKAKMALEEQFNKMQTNYDQRLSRRSEMPFLTEDEQKKLDIYAEKDPTALTDSEKKDQAALIKKGTELSSEVQVLRQKAEKDLTDADKNKIKEFDATLTKSQQQYEAVKADLANQIKSFDQTNSDKVNTDIRKAVSKVAEQKGFSVVFSNQFTLYAGADITDTVLSELNKK